MGSGEGSGETASPSDDESGGRRGWKEPTRVCGQRLATCLARMAPSKRESGPGSSGRQGRRGMPARNQPAPTLADMV
jgi:hypothetical protein